MTVLNSLSSRGSGPGGSLPPSGKRPRTAYLLQRRYRQLSRLAALVGAALGVALVAYSLGPSIAAGERLPLASFAVGALIIAALAIIPYAVVRWRWRRLKASLDDV